MKDNREKHFAEGYNLYKIFWIFFIFSLIGNLVEVVFCRFTMGRWMSRSSLLYGPFSIVWGLGGVILTIMLQGLVNKRDMNIFITGTVLGGSYEYLCSLVTETLFGAKFWDYSKHAFNIQGRISLLYCFFWGFVALLWVKDIYPRMSRWIERIPRKYGKQLTWALTLFMVVNMLLSGAALVRFSERQTNIPAAGRMDTFLDEHYPDDRLIERYSNMKLRTSEPGAESDTWAYPEKSN